MRLLVALPEARERRVGGSGTTLEVTPLLQWRPGHAKPAAAVIDPALLEQALPNGAWVDHVAAVGAPVIVWTDLSPEGMRGVLGARRLEPVRLIIDGVDDAPLVLARTLRSLPRLAHVRRLEAVLVSRLCAAPTGILAACVRAAHEPESMFSASDLARAAHLSRRHLDRELSGLGFAPAKSFVVAARLWLAWFHLVGEGRSAGEAALRIGYADAKALTRHVRIVGLANIAAFRSLPAEDCLALLTEHVTAG